MPRWPFGSVAAHTGKVDPAGIVDPALWRKISSGINYKDMLTWNGKGTS
jgi:chitinase